MGALVGVGIASDIHVNWGWQKGSVSQIAASWGIAPAIAAGFGAIIMLSIRVLVHSRKDPLQAALRVITFYYGLTAGILALFFVICSSKPQSVALEVLADLHFSWWSWHPNP